MALEFLQIVKSQAKDNTKGEDDSDNVKKFKNNYVLKEAIEVALSKMAKDKKDDPTKKIPENWDLFATSKEYRDLLEAMLDYNRELFRLENKQ